MREGGENDNKGLVSDIDGVQSLSGREMSSPMRDGVCVSVMVVVVVVVSLMVAMGIMVLMVVMGIVVLVIVVRVLCIAAVDVDYAGGVDILVLDGFSWWRC